MNEEASQIQRGFRVRGMVQGVGFRWWARRIAQELGVQGIVRNCPDGSVEVQARGTAGILEEFAERLEQGPATALVHAFEVFPTSEPLPKGFEIVRWP